MRVFVSVALATLAMSTSGMATLPDHEAELAKSLRGRVAGAPVDCLNIKDIRTTEIIDRTAILYTVVGGTAYLNRPEVGADSLSRDQVLVNDTRLPHLCRVDTVDLVDRITRIQNGTVGLGQFVPYTKVRH